MYRIGELAQLCNLKTDTLRFYEKHGLFTASARSHSGYRLYSSDDHRRLKFIIRAKSVGFSLKEINDLLSIEFNKSNWACADVKGLVETKLIQVETRIAELIRFQKSLTQLSEICCGGPESAEDCSILEALESSSSEKETMNQHPDTQNMHKGDICY